MLPERGDFFLSVPPAFAHLARPSSGDCLLKARLAERLAGIHAERQRQGKTRFLGAEDVLR